MSDMSDDDIRADDVQAAQTLQHTHRLADANAGIAGLDVGDAGRISRIERIEIEGDVDGRIADTLANVSKAQLRVAMLERLSDIDTAEDFARWRAR